MNDKEIVTYDTKNIDPSISPREDFYQYANGSWLKTATIPPSESRWGSFLELRDKSLIALHDILENLSKKENIVSGSDEAKLKIFYQTGMDEVKLNKDGALPLSPYIKKIESCKSIQDLTPLIAELHLMDVYPFWRPSVELDEKNSSQYALHIHQSGLGLPERDYYFREDDRSKALRIAYIAHIKNIFNLLGMSNIAVERIMDIEIELAKVSMKAEDLRDVEKLYNVYDRTTLIELSPHIDWNQYFSLIGFLDQENIIVSQPQFIQTVSELLTKTPIEDTQSYLIWRLIRSTAFALSDNFVEEYSQFYLKTLTGAQEIKPRWKRCIAVIDMSLGEALGKEYVAKYFSPDAKNKINDLVDNLIAVYRKRILALDWMGEETKQKALEKLNNIGRKLGYPDVWRDYSKLEVMNDSYLENILRARRFENNRQIKKIGRPIDRTEWLMTPPTVNAYYDPQMNEIGFPAAIIQAPFFDTHAEDAYNYAGIGSVIGHELTHGFDDSGALFDKDGNLHNWWTKEDKEKFKQKGEALISQFNSFKVFDDLAVNGKLTLGENIADLGGLLIAYDAFIYAKQKNPSTISNESFSPEQRFFICHAQSCQMVYKEEFERLMVLTDPHAPDRFRVNGPLSNIEEFMTAFGCKEGDAMYRKKEGRVHIW